MLNTDVNKFRSVYTSLTLTFLFEVFVEDRFKTLSEDGNAKNFSQDPFFIVAPSLDGFIRIKLNSSEDIFPQISSTSQCLFFDQKTVLPHFKFLPRIKILTQNLKNEHIPNIQNSTTSSKIALLETKSYQEEITFFKLVRKNSNWDDSLRVENLSLLFSDCNLSF
jgi:hypothetical protein